MIEARRSALARGFDEAKNPVEFAIAGIVSELGEMFHASRRKHFADRIIADELYAKLCEGKFDKELFESKIKDSFEDEIADAIIWLCNVAESRKVDLAKHIKLKQAYNATRS